MNTTDQKAALGVRLVEAATALYGDVLSSWGETVSDILADLMHAVDRTSLDFDELLARARENYEAEKEESSWLS